VSLPATRSPQRPTPWSWSPRGCKMTPSMPSCRPGHRSGQTTGSSRSPRSGMPERWPLSRRPYGQGGGMPRTWRASAWRAGAVPAGT